jgi:hypothetical protein
MGYGEKLVSVDSFRSGGVEVLFCFLCPGDSHIELSILAGISSLIQVARKGVLGVFIFRHAQEASCCLLAPPRIRIGAITKKFIVENDWVAY